MRQSLPVLTSLIRAALCALTVCGPALVARSADPNPAAGAKMSVADYASIQEALDANPGKMMYVPPGDYSISKRITINHDGSGLFGYGKIIQTNPEEPIIEITGVSGVRLKDLTFTRAEGKMDTQCSGIHALKCENLVIEGAQVLNNRTRLYAIHLDGCRNCQVLNCLVENYMRVLMDDRTTNPDYGYALMELDGAGISSRSSSAILIQGNRIEEHNLLPTEETRKKYRLGELVKMNATKGKLVQQATWDAKHTILWQQGSAIECRISHVPRGQPQDRDASHYTQIIGNYIENASQGMDIHGDHVIVANNVVNDSYMGMKTMHGSRNVIITGNQFVKSALWGIYVSPGALATTAKAATATEPAKPANTQAGTIIANNIISDFGYGHSEWIWKNSSCAGIFLDKGQNPYTSPVTDVLIEGNVIYDPGKDGILTADGKVEIAPPRYEYAVFQDATPGGPVDIKYANNIFAAGTKGLSNIPLTAP